VSPAVQKRGPLHPDGYVLPFRLDTTKTSATVRTTTHAWAPQHKSWNNGKMDNWMPRAPRLRRRRGRALAVGYCTREDLGIAGPLGLGYRVPDPAP